MEIRKAKECEYESLYKLFYDTIHRVNIRDYSREQVRTWAPKEKNMKEWKERISEINPYIIIKSLKNSGNNLESLGNEDIKNIQNKEILAFGDVQNDGYIDFFYVSYKYQRMGVGKKLFEFLEGKAKKENIKSLYTHGSITSVKFFKSLGFEIESERRVNIRGVFFKNYLMRKIIV